MPEHMPADRPRAWCLENHEPTPRDRWDAPAQALADLESRTKTTDENNPLEK